jgi:hypothetical protein
MMETAAAVDDSMTVNHVTSADAAVASSSANRRRDPLRFRLTVPSPATSSPTVSMDGVANGAGWRLRYKRWKTLLERASTVSSMLSTDSPAPIAKQLSIEARMEMADEGPANVRLLLS